MANTVNSPATATETSTATSTEADDPIGYFCRVTGECLEAAIFYLEGFQWKPEDAVNGFYDGSLPPRLWSSSEEETAMKSAIKRLSPSEVPPPPPKRLRSPSPLKSGDGSFRFRDDSGEAWLSSDVAEVDETSKPIISMACPANASYVKESSEGEVVDRPSSMETSTTPTTKSNLEIQLADGTTSDYIGSSAPDEPKDYQVTDMDQTIEMATTPSIQRSNPSIAKPNLSCGLQELQS